MWVFLIRRVSSQSENIMSGEAAEVNTERLRAANKEAYSFIMVLMNRIRPYVLIWRVSGEWRQFIFMFFLSPRHNPVWLSPFLSRWYSELLVLLETTWIWMEVFESCTGVLTADEIAAVWLTASTPTLQPTTAEELVFSDQWPTLSPLTWATYISASGWLMRHEANEISHPII